LARQIEELETTFSRKRTARIRVHNPKLAAGDPPFNVIAGTNVQLLGKRLGNTHLKLARNFRHCLTVAGRHPLPIISARGNHFSSGVVHSSTSPTSIASDIGRRVHPRSLVACEMLTCGRGCRKMAELGSNFILSDILLQATPSFNPDAHIGGPR